MHDPEERPRFRWRMLAWGLAAVILPPVLYVAASGPIVWWVGNHYRAPEWHAEYRRSLTPLQQSPPFAAMLTAYRVWWTRLPAPHSWNRQKLVDKLADRRKNLEDARAERMRREADTAEAAALQTRLDALDAQTSPAPVEAIGIRLRLDEIAVKWGRAGSQITPLRLTLVGMIEELVREAEAELRQFDAQ